MNAIVAPKVEKYIYDLLPQRDQVLTEIEAVAESRAIPIVGPAVGRVLLQLAKMIDARRIFEMGSAVGYSTIWLARGTGRNGIVYYTDKGEENARQAAAYFKRAGVGDKVRLLIGDAIDLIDTIEGNFDIIFIDIDKQQYPQAFAKAYPRLRQGGLLVSDNVLRSDTVMVTNGKRDPITEGIREFNRLIYAVDDLFTTILPIRYGISISLKM